MLYKVLADVKYYVIYLLGIRQECNVLHAIRQILHLLCAQQAPSLFDAFLHAQKFRFHHVRLRVTHAVNK